MRDGKIVVAGSIRTGGGYDMFAARLEGDPGGASSGQGPAGSGKPPRCAGKSTGRKPSAPRARTG